MKKLLILIAVIFIFTPVLVFCEDKQTPPSFSEFADWNHRHPDTDINIDLYMHHWKDSDIHIGHGGFIEREILFPGDPLNPSKPGAVLKYIKAYNHGVLEAGCTTQPTMHEKEQVFFYVTKGCGKVDAGGVSELLSEGSGVFMPAKLEYRFTNTTQEPMEAIIIVEDIPNDFIPKTSMSVGNYHNNIPYAGMHWAHIGRSICDCSFANPMGIAVVTIDAFDIAQPHVHGEGCEEIWCQLKGKSLLLFGNRLRWQREGEAFLIPPNGKVPHASINHTDEPMQWLYLGNRHDRKK